ncbi:MAG: hypothetical protein Pg6C_03020 [Treponemataceae bacterium]|nr:MAG: hypothetical protein Pg6C_03020 [Treponemataceae bacterium]
MTKLQKPHFRNLMGEKVQICSQSNRLYGQTTNYEKQKTITVEDWIFIADRDLKAAKQIMTKDGR